MSDLPLIRCATLSDLPAVVSVAASGSPWAPQYPLVFYRQVVEAGRGEPVHRGLLVSEAAGGVTGFAVVSMLVAVAPAEAELESLAVAPVARGCGTGRALVQAAVTWAAGASVFRLEVRSRNEAAIRLYRRCGFDGVATRPGYYSGPADDAFCMEMRPPVPGR